MTVHDTARRQFASSSLNFTALVNLIHTVNSRKQTDGVTLVYTKEEEMVLERIYFILGNLTATNDRNRNTLFTTSDLTNILMSGSLENRMRNYPQMAIKWCRVVANMTIHAPCGKEWAHNEKLYKAVQQALEKTIDHDEDDDGKLHQEELKLNLISVVTNLAFYCTLPTSCHFQLPPVECAQLVELLTPSLYHSNPEAVLETCRAFGNLSRLSSFLTAMFNHHVFEVLEVLLEHRQADIILTSCGVFMNAAMIPSLQKTMLENKSLLTQLVQLVRTFGFKNWTICSMACKTLSNVLGLEKEMEDEKWMRILENTLEELLHAVGEDDLDEDEKAFTRVARVLQHTLQGSNISLLSPLVPLEDDDNNELE